MREKKRERSDQFGKSRHTFQWIWQNTYVDEPRRVHTSEFLNSEREEKRVWFRHQIAKRFPSRLILKDFCELSCPLWIILESLSLSYRDFPMVN